MSEFEARNQALTHAMSQDTELKQLSRKWMDSGSKYEYSYHFRWLGRPIIQYPQDIVAIQELIWLVKPDLIIETGVAHGGSLILSASILQLIGKGNVVGIDIDIRPHNRQAIEEHPMAHRIKLIQGSSVEEETVEQVRELAKNSSVVMVFLDSNHTHEHVLKELELYSPLVTQNSYLVVFDTVVEDMPPNSFPDRPWDIGNNPKTAVREFLANTDRFEIASDIEDKLLITVASEGYLRCVKA